MNAVRAALLVLLMLISGLASAQQGVTLPEYHYVELDNGAVFILTEKRDVPLIGVTALIRGGAVADPEGKAGLGALFADMLRKGAGSRDAAEFAETVDSSGAVLSTSAGLENISISGEFLATDADLLVELLTDMLRSPTLDRAEFNKLRDRSADLLRAAKDGDLRSLSPVYGAAWLFGDHPYGTPVAGDEASLESLRHGDLMDYYQDSVGADRLIVSIVGDFDATEMINQLTAAFSDWRLAAQPLPDIEPAVAEAGRRVLLVDKPGATQSYFWIGNVGVARGFEQRAELDIANTLFGGRFTSLLVQEMRTKAGLTYGAYSALSRPTHPGSVAIVSYTKTETTIEAMDLALELLQRMKTEGFSEALITSGKNYILGQFPPRLETSTQLADQFADLTAAGLDENYVNQYGDAVASAASENVQSVINSVYPDPANLVFVVIGDAELIREDVAQYGPVTEMAITEPRFTPE